MKSTFIETMAAMMRKHEDMVIVTADMGFSVFEGIQEEFPDRFMNNGVTEQASASFAAGMAMSGHKVFFYAQAAFSTMRCFEQVRLDIGYNNLNVKVIGVNGGYGLNQLGVSHLAVEDVALMRLIPTMTIFSPADPIEMAWALNECYNIDGPTYLRYTKLGNHNIHPLGTKITLGKFIPVREGTDATLFATGGIIEAALQAHDTLAKENISLAIYSAPTIRPLDTKIILSEAKKTKRIFTLEEHGIAGGLGTSVAEVMAESDVRAKLKRIGGKEEYPHTTGSMNYLLKYNGITPEDIVLQIKKTL